MSSPVAAPSRARSLGDSFAIGVLIMLAVNVLQRGVGFLRGIGLARFLSDVDLGQWALANSFLIIAVPIAVLGLPGSFGKFIEHFRRGDRLRIYLHRVLFGTLAGTLVASIAILTAPNYFTWLIFGSPQSMELVVWCVVCLLTTVGLSFLSELAAGFRQVQTISYMQFAQSLAFTVMGLGLVIYYQTWWVLLPAYAAANCIAMIPGIVKLRREHADEFDSSSGRRNQGESRRVWRSILPFAASLWTMNLLSNLFAVGDRYMLLHLIGGNEQFGQAMVGQYHCARILPNLLLSVGMMLGGILLPFLSADWEAGRHQQVYDRVQQLIKTVALGFLALSVAAMAAAPLLFHFVFQGRYQLAEAVLPLALAQAIWVALATVAEPFMLCVDRGKQLVALTLVSLIANLALNWYFIQWYGLYGAVLATCVANVMGLGLLFWRMHRCGCRFDRGILLLCSAPVLLLAGPVGSMMGLVALVFMAGRTDFLLSQADRDQVDALAIQGLERIGLRCGSIWPSNTNRR